MRKELFVSIATAIPAGRIKKLNGGNLGPSMIYAHHPEGNLNREFAELNLPLTRLHDAPWENPGMRLVDIPQIFANPKADPEDPESYYFDQTDDYIQNIIETGTGIIYRLGVSIEHGLKRYFLKPPADVSKWVAICANIIRHLNYGKWNGHNFDIRYWEIWNEPCNWDKDSQGNPTLAKMWDGTMEEFNRFYCEAASALKKLFPELKFGGPSHGVSTGNLEPFLQACRQTGAPLDFYSWHCYSDSVERYRDQVPEVRRIVDAAGFPDAELHLNEWHYHPRVPDDYYLKMSVPEQRAFRSHYIRDGKGLDSGAFICAVQTAWQDVPLDMGCYYTTGLSNYGIFDGFYETTKSYFGMKAFGKIVRYPFRIKTEASSPVYALAGHDSGERFAVVVSVYRGGPANLTLDFDAIPEIPEVFGLNELNDLTPIRFQLDEQKLHLEVSGNSAVFLIEFTIKGGKK